jgi:hypothetical protein
MFGIHLLRTKCLLAMCHRAHSRIADSCSTESNEKRKKPLSEDNTSSKPRERQILLAIDLATGKGSFGPIMMQTSWSRGHEVCIIWYQSLTPLIRLYHFKISVSCWFCKNSLVSNFFFSLNLRLIKKKKFVISLCYCSKYISSFKNKKKQRKEKKEKNRYKRRLLVYAAEN